MLVTAATTKTGWRNGVKEIFEGLIKELAENPNLTTATHSCDRGIVVFSREDLQKSTQALWLEFNTKLAKLPDSTENNVIFGSDIIGQYVILKNDKEEQGSSSIIKAGTELLCVGTTFYAISPRNKNSFVRDDCKHVYILTDFSGTVFCERDEFLCSSDL